MKLKSSNRRKTRDGVEEAMVAKHSVSSFSIILPAD